MNRERVTELAERLERLHPPVPNMGFDMKSVIYDMSPDECPTWAPPSCRTAGCLAGWACALWSLPDFSLDAAREALGLDNITASRLFVPSGGPLNVYDASPHEAARVLRNLLATGEVNWWRMSDTATTE